MNVTNSDLTVEQVDIASGFDRLADERTDHVIDRAAVHFSVDPITGQYQISVYTDDGNGNGDHIMTVHLK